MTGTTLATAISNGVFLLMLAGIPLYAATRKVKVFESFVDGAKGAIPLMINLIPYFVGMLVVIGMLRASGAFDLMSRGLAPLLKWIGMPAELLPLALMRPFSGQASNGILVDLIHQTGPDSFISTAAATMMGSTETTFYAIAIYFGAVNIRKTRHAIPAGLFAELVGIIAAIWICYVLGF